MPYLYWWLITNKICIFYMIRTHKIFAILIILKKKEGELPMILQSPAYYYQPPDSQPLLSVTYSQPRPQSQAAYSGCYNRQWWLLWVAAQLEWSAWLCSCVCAAMPVWALSRSCWRSWRVCFARTRQTTSRQWRSTATRSSGPSRPSLSASWSLCSAS